MCFPGHLSAVVNGCVCGIGRSSFLIFPSDEKHNIFILHVLKPEGKNCHSDGKVQLGRWWTSCAAGRLSGFTLVFLGISSWSELGDSRCVCSFHFVFVPSILCLSVFISCLLLVWTHGRGSYLPLSHVSSSFHVSPSCCASFISVSSPHVSSSTFPFLPDEVWLRVRHW